MNSSKDGPVRGGEGAFVMTLSTELWQFGRCDSVTE